MRKIVIVGEAFSSNLGDGVIADSLVFLFRRSLSDICVNSADISGRVGRQVSLDKFSRYDNWRRALYKRQAPFAVHTMARLLKWSVINRKRYISVWRPVLVKASELVIGGGQLLMDNALNFPLKINFITNLAESLGIRWHFSACGVGRNWSPIASLLFRRPLLQASSITVRDTVSLQRLRSIAPAELPFSPVATFDPAIWAAEVYGKGFEAKGEASPIGLGVIGLEEVNCHAPPGCRLNEQTLSDFWLNVIDQLYQRGMTFELFTNGSLSDYAIALEICRRAEMELSIVCPLCKRPKEPEELVLQIARYRGVIAARLHANIIALSYGIPTIGVVWDDKVEALHNDTDRADFCISIYEQDPIAVVQALLQSLKEGVDRHSLMHWKDRAFENVKVVLGNYLA